jgi:TPR repeat protein
MQNQRNLLLSNGYLTYENLRCNGLVEKLIQQLLQGMGCGLPVSNKKRIIMMRFIMTRVYSKWMASVRDEAAKDAAELCASGRCAAALVPLQKTIDLGHLPSRALFAQMLLDGREGVAKDCKGAFELVEEGARFGCHHCQGVMAWCYWGGRGIPQDVTRSLELARESSEKGSRYGQYVLGRLYVYSIPGTAQNTAQADALYQLAAALYRLAAAQNLDRAQLSLGYMYHHGQGVDRDRFEELRWYQLAAAQGNPQALFEVAECHERGRGGVRHNKAEAIRWYRRAQAAGYPDAATALQRLRA